MATVITIPNHLTFPITPEDTPKLIAELVVQGQPSFDLRCEVNTIVYEYQDYGSENDYQYGDSLIVFVGAGFRLEHELAHCTVTTHEYGIIPAQWWVAADRKKRAELATAAGYAYIINTDDDGRAIAAQVIEHPTELV